MYVCVSVCVCVCVCVCVYLYLYTHTHRVIKKSLCTWWLQFRKLQVMFKVSPASLQTFIDMPNCVLEDRVQYSTVHIPNVFCDGHLQLINCVYYNYQVHRDFLITLCIYINIYCIYTYIYSDFRRTFLPAIIHSPNTEGALLNQWLDGRISSTHGDKNYTQNISRKQYERKQRQASSG